ncbi:MAG: hypothetical protein AAFR66_01360 [Bacteroidota bacterium]
MRSITFLFLSLLTVGFTFSQDSTAQQVLEKYRINAGGEELWEALESITFQGSIILGEETYPIKITQVKPNLQRVEMVIREDTVIQAFDGQRAWMLNPLNGNPSPSFLPEDQLLEWQSNSLDNNLFKTEEKGLTPTLLGKIKVDDRDAYMLSLANQEQILEFYFIDPDLYRPTLNRKIISTGPARGQRLETYMSDYRETEGYMLPYTLETRINDQLIQQITWETIEVQQEVDTRLFIYPPLLSK